MKRETYIKDNGGGINMRKEIKNLIELVQSKFGNDHGIPNGLPKERPRLPGWIEGSIGNAIEIEKDDYFILEGPPYPIDEDAQKEATIEEYFAYYLPFHFYKKDWGIYIRALGIEQLAAILNINDPKIAKDILFYHELFHFITELAVSRVESKLDRPIYSLSGFSSGALLRKGLFGYFFDSQASLLEESLANAYSYNSLRKSNRRQLLRELYNWMRGLAPGYRDFYRWIGKKFDKGLENNVDIIKNICKKFFLKSDGLYIGWLNIPIDKDEKFFISQKNYLKRLEKNPTSIFFLKGGIYPPTYFVIDISGSRLLLVKPFPKKYGIQIFVHANDHKPPHIHIWLIKNNIETKYEWPVLQPLPGCMKLPRKYKKSLENYVQVYGVKIEENIRKAVWK